MLLMILEGEVGVVEMTDVVMMSYCIIKWMSKLDALQVETGR